MRYTSRLSLPFILLAATVATSNAADPAAPQPIAKLPGPAGIDVAFSRDGKLILTAGGDEARVWDATTFEPVTPPLLHAEGESIDRASLSPDGDRVLTVASGVARIWDVAGGRAVHDFRLGDPDRVTFAAYSPDGSTVLTTGTDNKARLWDAQAYRELHVLNHEAAVMFAAFDPAGSRLLTLSDSTIQTGAHVFSKFAGSNDARVWDVKTGKMLSSRDADIGPKPGRTTRRPATFMADGARVVSIGTWIAFVWDATTGRRVSEVDGRAEYLGWELGSASVFALSADGARIAIAGHVAAGIWDVRKGLHEKQPLAVLRVQGIDDIQFSPDGRRVLISNDTDDAGVWNIATGRQLLSLYPTRPIEDQPTAKTPPRMLQDPGRRLQPAKVATDLPAIAFSPDGRRVAAGFASDGFTGVWEVPDPKGQ